MKTLSTRKISIAIGVSLLSMAILAGFSHGFVWNEIVVPNNPSATQQNLKVSSNLFLLGVAGWISILLLDIAVSFLLYAFFKDTQKVLARFMAVIRLVYSVILTVAVYHLSQLTSSNAVEEIGHNIHLFENTWSLGLIIFGFHLVLLGILVIKNKTIHSLWGILLLIAGVSYTLIHSLYQIESLNHFTETLELILALPMTIAELGLGIVLWVKGGKKYT